MLRVASVTAGRAVRRAACAEGLVATPSARRAVGGEIAAGGMGRKWEDKEHGQEAVYFDKEDRELLRKLAKKANKPNEAQLKQDMTQLDAILSKHNASLPDACKTEILQFKHAH
mmetsp:Transcript_5029/g.13546  ORF Transcript_5029/g.13546 Transcript_5029/m.13546 type:complete len:114 (-) Transcript_5029:193-534(-)